MPDYGVYNFEEIKKNLDRIKNEEKEPESTGVDVSTGHQQPSGNTGPEPIYFPSSSGIVKDYSWGKLSSIG